MVQVVKRLVQHSNENSRLVASFWPLALSRRILSLVDVFSIVSALRDQGVEDKRSFGESEGIDVLEFAQVESLVGLFVTGRWRLRARCSWMVGHGGNLMCERCFLRIIEAAALQRDRVCRLRRVGRVGYPMLQSKGIRVRAMRLRIGGWS